MINIEKELEALSINEEVHIPSSLRKRVNETYDQLGVKGRNKNKIIKVASIFAAILLCTNLVEPTFAEEIPLVGPVLKILNNKMGINIRYTDNGLVVKENFYTENYKVNIETVDYDGDSLLLVYKVTGINKATPWPCTIQVDIQSNELIIDNNGSMATGSVEDGEYYGYQQYAIKSNDSIIELKEVNLQITPKILTAGNKDESFIERKTINLIIKNKNYR